MKTTALPGVFQQKRNYYTKNLTPGIKFFDQEFLKQEQGVEYRELSPRSSKLCAALAKGCRKFGLHEGSVVLYLGASHGYTPSFVSDIIGAKGLVYCVEFAPSVARDLVFVCEARENMVPLLADAVQPQEYASRITGVDIVYQDIAQRDQVDIFLKNVDMYLRKGGTGLLAVKARSVDTTRPPKEVFKDVRRQLQARKDLKIIEYRELAPLEKDHAFFVVQFGARTT